MDIRINFLAVFHAEHIADGPVTKIHLDHHVPISFNDSIINTKLSANLTIKQA